MHAIPADRSCGPEVLVQCGGRVRSLPSSEAEGKRRVAAALGRVADDYPEFEKLRRLTVEFASLDLVCFADHSAQCLFSAVRGTDRSFNPRTTPNDMRSNVSIILGYGPPRADTALREYRRVRESFPGYVSYGCGHSLGGAVILHTAKAVEDLQGLAFERIDVFNTATSPLKSSFTPLSRTTLHAHRVEGDWASWGLQHMDLGNAQVHIHDAKSTIQDCHSLKHFLPSKAVDLEPAPSIDNRVAEPRHCEVTASGELSLRRHWSHQSWWSGLLGSCVGLHRKGRCQTPAALSSQSGRPQPLLSGEKAEEGRV